MATENSYCDTEMHLVVDVQPYPWCLLKIFKLAVGYLDFVSDVSKESSLDTELKYTVSVTMHERFPDDSWLHVYSDSLAEGTIRNAGTGVYSTEFAISYAVGQL
ncbi:hypothetical protein CEXT_85911 [Caerostris extrusa]|uniref:Uncharacterized protein n=1 Tax=Caerostris extrusa TaxID=172846 RepID=A0AAV4MIX8_CAEEX|nr:hypothetical protein CEXT_85911 [Caerostris extrusa]